MLDNLKTLINTANEDYEVFYEESRMFNVDADELSTEGSYCYIEEFVSGTFNLGRWKEETTTVQLYFFKIPEQTTIEELTAEQRITIRETIKTEVVLDLLDLLRVDRQNQTTDFRWFYPVPKYDCNEVGLIVEFEYKKKLCAS